jgi:hypothetical protein
MKKSNLLLSLGLVLLLNSCASTYSCNATAGDKCLDVDQVDAMSKDGTTLETLEQTASASQVAPVNFSNPGGERIWIAPYTDAKGQYHAASVVYLPPKTSTNEGESNEF